MVAKKILVEAGGLERFELNREAARPLQHRFGEARPYGSVTGDPIRPKVTTEGKADAFRVHDSHWSGLYDDGYHGALAMNADREATVFPGLARILFEEHLPQPLGVRTECHFAKEFAGRYTRAPKGSKAETA